MTELTWKKYHQPLDDLEHNLGLQERYMDELAQAKGEYHHFQSQLDNTPVERPDMVNQPPHYNQGNIECIDYIEDFLTEDEYRGYLRGNIAKYLHRYPLKGGLQDLKKVQWYLQRLIDLEDR